MKRGRDARRHTGFPDGSINTTAGAAASSSSSSSNNAININTINSKRNHQAMMMSQNNNDNNSRPHAATAEELGPFRALLALHGVVWDDAEEGEDSEEGGGKGAGATVGFYCRHSPSSLRLGVEKVIKHDSERRREFVQVVYYQYKYILYYY